MINLAALRANIWKMYVYSALSGLVFYYLIDKLFMQTRGLTVGEIDGVEIVYIICVLIFEVPSGALSDRWSRKYVLLLNQIAFGVGSLIWLLSPNAAWFSLGALLFALHVALESGTDTSFLYDTLRALRKEGQFEKIYGRSTMFGTITAFVAGIVGGVVAQNAGYEATFWITFVPVALAALIALTLTEPPVHRSTQPASYWRHIRETGQYVFSHRRLIVLTVVSVVTGSALALADEYGQLYYAAVGLPLVWFGAVGGVGSLIEGGASGLSHHLKAINHRVLFGAD